MKGERLIKQGWDLALSLGGYVLYQIRELETPPPQPASFTYYEGTPLEAEERYGDNDTL